MGLSQRIGQLVREVPREIDDAVHFLVPQQPFGFGHRGAGMGQSYIRRSVPPVQKLPTLRAIAQVHHRHRHIRDLLVPIERLVDQRVRECRDDEDHRHARIAENAPKLIHESG